MLAWLASAVPEVRGALLRLAFDVALDPSEVEVVTQLAIPRVGVLDAVLEAPGHRLVVESKLRSSYGEDQIRRYLGWLARLRDGKASALMTLTAKVAPWRDDEKTLASELSVGRAEKRWEELHEALQPFLDEAEEGDIAARVTRDFLAMLADEDLIPFAPLSGRELETAWADAWAVVRRYRDFFRSCRSYIAEGLGGSPAAAGFGDRGDWYWQDYILPGDVRLAIGIFHTDENDARRPSRSPILWASVRTRPDMSVEGKARFGQPPEEWSKGSEFYGRPTIWRPLSNILTGATTIDEQREAVVGAARQARDWYDSGSADLGAGDAT